jgi:hypothetical protein
MNQTWQHRTAEFPIEYGLLGDPKFASSDLAAACDRYAEQGWELVSTFSMSWGPSRATQKIVAVFRRKVSQPPPLPEEVPSVFKISSEA